MSVSHTTHSDFTETHEEILRLLDRGDDQQASLNAVLQRIEGLAEGHPGRAHLLAAAHRAIAIGQRLEHHRQNEASLRAVFESAQTLTELKALDQVLFEIVERGRHLMGSDLAWLAAMDPDEGSLRVIAVSGVFSNETLKTISAVDFGVAGHVLRTRSPFATNDYMGDVNFEHSPGTDLMIQREGLISLVAVPLLYGAEVSGILLVGDRSVRNYLPRELSVLATLAAHASVAVRNARAFDLTRQALFKAEQANQQLVAQTASLEYAADAHEQLTKLLAKGAALKELVQAIARILDGQVVFLDAAGIELCASIPAGFETPQVIDTYQGISGMAAGIQSALSQSRITGRATVAVIPGTDLHCQVAAVMGKDELFGALVVRTRTPLSEQAVRVLERSALAMAVLQISAAKTSVSQDQDINLTLRTLIEPNLQQDTDELPARLARHGVDITQPTMLASVIVDKGKLGYAVRQLMNQRRNAPLIATEIAGQVVIVVNQSDPVAFQEALHRLLFDKLSISARAVFAGPLSVSSGLAQAYGHLQRAQRLLHALKRGDCVVHEAALRTYAVLFQHQSAEALEATIETVIGSLVRHDARRSAQLADTLRTYLDHNQNAKTTAGVLNIHVNTLHNRLEAIQALLGPWDTDGRTAEIHLILRLARLRETLPTSQR